MKITFEPSAQDELDRISSWIGKDNPRAAGEMIARIEDISVVHGARSSRAVPGTPHTPNK